MTLSTLFLLILVVSAYSSPVEPRNDTPEYRLPADAAKPYYYNIELRMEKDVFVTDRYTGIVSVYFTNLKSTNQILIHANELEMSSVLLVSQDGTLIDLPDQDFKADNITDILTITTSTPLAGGTNYQLQFNYTAILRTDEMYGFYKSYYIAPDNSTRYLGTTQFQATSARKVFPCFDEPIYKAEFDIKIRHPSEYNAIGNTAASARIDSSDSDFTITSFATTPIMSTYLIAFVVSDFTCTTSEELIEEGVPHIVCSRDEEKDNRKVAVEAGPKLVHVLENFTGIKYSASRITKMHEFAIPDFSAGAMENWGLLTYRETNLLWDEDQTSNSYLQSIKNVIAHEVAHMWFGNLVTCHWWSDTFLNEGFARYFQYHATAEIEPSWELDKQFVIAQVQTMLASDALTTSAPLSYDASSPSQVSGRFSSVSYNKGASILRWIKFFIGADNFKTGIQQYLQDHKFGNTYPEDLWSALQGATPSGALPSGTNLSQVIENWIVKGGFPVLDVKVNGTGVTVSQKRFLVSGTPGNDEKWYVPITYTLSSDSNKFEDTTTKTWLLPSQSSITIDNVLNNDDDWIILNNQQIGYYRINYDDDLWVRIMSALRTNNFGGINELNRAQIVDDFYNFAKIGLHTYSDVFDMFQFLENDTSYYPWYAAITAFSNMLQRTGSENIRAALSTHILQLIKNLYEAHPFNSPNNDNQIYTFNRVQAITWACRLGMQECIDDALAAFKNYKETKIKPDKNLKSAIYCNGLRYSTNAQEDWDFLWEEYGNTKLASEKVTILSALGCTTDETVLTNYILKSIDPNSGIRQQDASSVFSSAYTQNPEGVDIAFEFLLENYQDIADYYGTMNALNSLFTGLAGRFTRQDQIVKLETFLNEATDLSESLLSSAQSALTTARANLEWTEIFERELSLYFSLGASDSLKVGVTTFITTLMLLVYQYFY